MTGVPAKAGVTDGPPRNQLDPEDHVKLLRFLIAGAALMASVGDAMAQDAAAGEQVFAKCRACHQIGEGAKNMVGPGSERGRRPKGRHLPRLQLFRRE